MVERFLLLALWTVAFVALPSISGWFLAICSVVFVTANTTFSYLIPSAIIRLLSLLRTATRYFERLENHKTTLSVQQRLQLKIFRSVAVYPISKSKLTTIHLCLRIVLTELIRYLTIYYFGCCLFRHCLTISVYFIFLSIFRE